MEDLSDNKPELIALSEKIQKLTLQRWVEKLEDGTISPTEVSALAKALSQRGMLIVDRTELPNDLKGMLTKDVDPGDLDDGDVLPLMRREA